MRITFRNSRFEAIASYQEKDALKSAGFRWDAEARCWFTALPDIATQFRDVADETAIQEMDMVAEKIERSKSAEIDASVQIPAPSGRYYFPYQHAGIAFASKRPATLIGDEMGLGKTIQAEDRFRQLLTANPFLELVRVYDGKASDEKALHADFQIKGKGVLREWFRLDNSDLEKIDSHFHALSI